MTQEAASPYDPDGDALIAAILLAIDPAGLGGARLRGLPGPGRDQWLSALRALFGTDAPWRKMPAQIDDERLLGGLDLSATLRLGQPVLQRGVLAESDGGVVLQAMAERVPAGRAARIAAVMDAGGVALERDGLTDFSKTRFALILLDEGLEPDEAPPAPLLDRVAFHIDISGPGGFPDFDLFRDAMPDRQDILAVRQTLARVTLDEEVVTSLCIAAEALGVYSMRAPILAARCAKALAALDGRTEVAPADAATAARLVLAPRATRIPAPPEMEDDDQEDDPPPEENPPNDQQDPPEDDPEEDKEKPEPEQNELTEIVVDAAHSAIPAGLLATLAEAAGARRPKGQTGKSGAGRRGYNRGRPVGARPGKPGSGKRLNVLQTLRAAAPWQAVRRREAEGEPRDGLDIRREDFRITQYKEKTETTTIFVVDASGSSAINRLAEAKGAVELLLGESYSRRDHVALITFGGKKVDLALPPTRSLARAKRLLAGLPGGGGTPMANAFDAAAALADAVKRKGQTPIVVTLTDGRANIARDGSTIRAAAEEDAKAAARALGATGAQTLFIDIAPRSRPFAAELARAMRATYLAMPHADARRLSAAVGSAVDRK